MPYEVLLKKAHELVDAASPEKIEWVVGVLEGEKCLQEESETKRVLAFVKKYSGAVQRQIDEKAELSAHRGEKCGL